MADETADISNTEQLAVCFRWIDKNMEVHEDFVGLHPLSKTTADSIVQVLKDVLLRMNLDLNDIRRQCYGGAATMSGKASGVATQFKLENEKMLYTHCYGHALNLAIKDACDKVECLKEAFDSIREICRLVKKSPQRDTKLSEILSATQSQEKSIHAFCPTRWTVRAETLRSVIENHDELMALWEWSIKHLKDTEMKARVIGVNTAMSNFSFFYECALGESMLRLTDHLGRSLQDSKPSAAEGQEIAANTVRTLLKDRNEDSFDLFRNHILMRQAKMDVNDPVIPRKRKTPTRFEQGSSVTYAFFESPKDFYRQKYYDAYDFVINAIQDRLDQKDFKVYKSIQDLLFKSIKKEDFDDEFNVVVEIYRDDVNDYLLKTQLSLFLQVASNLNYDVEKINISDIMALFRCLTPAKQQFLSEAVKLGKILIVAPAANTTSERSFSALKRVKGYLQATMGQNRLNHLMFLHVHSELTDKIDLVEAADSFVGNINARKKLFGTFSDTDRSNDSC